MVHVVEGVDSTVDNADTLCSCAHVCYSVYSNWYRDAQSLRAWLFDYLPSRVVTLTPAKFRSDVLASSDPWIIDFYAPWCGHCQVFAPEFEQVAQVWNVAELRDNVHISLNSVNTYSTTYKLTLVLPHQSQHKIWNIRTGVQPAANKCPKWFGKRLHLQPLPRMYSSRDLVYVTCLPASCRCMAERHSYSAERKVGLMSVIDS